MTLPPEPDDAELERQLRDSRGLEAAPEHVIQRAFTIWQPRRPAAAPPSLLQRLVAVIGFDSGWTALPAAGVRSAAARQRQVLFTIGSHDLDLRIRPQPGEGFVLSGQLLGPDVRGELSVQVAGHHQRVALDTLAEFRFDAVPAGECRLVLHLAGADCELPPVLLDAP